MRYESYQALNFPIRDFEIVNNGAVSFCSAIWVFGNPPVGQRIYKSAAHLLFMNHPLFEQVLAFHREYGRNKEFSKIMAVILEHRPRIKQLINYISCRKMVNKKKGLFTSPKVVVQVQPSAKTTQKTKRRNKKRNNNVKKRTNFSSMEQRYNNLVQVSGLQEYTARKLCGLVNPFCPEAVGSKWPDIGAEFTTPYTTRVLISVSTLLSSAQGGNFTTPWLSTQSYTASTVSANAITAWTASATDPNYSNLNANYKDYRVVSWGIKYNTTMAWTSSTGTIQIGYTCYDATTAASLPCNSLMTATDMEMFRVTDAEFIFISRPTDMSSSDYGAVSSAQVWLNWTYPLLTINAAPQNTTLGYIELVAHYELRALAATAVINTSTRPSAPNSTLMEAASSLRDMMNSTTSGNEKFVDQSIMKDAMHVVAMYGPLLLRTVRDMRG
jgi:hypothetical protein